MATIKSTDALLFVLIFAALLLRLLLSPPIWHHGEAREGLVVQGIVHNQEWILPFGNGDLPSKPPLFHWIAALTALVFGLSDFIVRLPSAIGAEVMAIATFVLGRAMGGRKIGWLAVGALLGMYEFWDSGSDARVDMIFAACVTVSLTGFFFWYRAGRKTARVACYIAAAFAVLAKGPAGIVLPGVVILGFLAAEGQLRLLWKLWSWSLAGIVLFIDLGWYAIAYQIGGSAFLGVQIWEENVSRALGKGVSTQNNFLTLTSWLATRTLPWCLVLIFSFIQRCRGAPEDSAGRFLHAWWIAIFAVFALAAGKRSVYLLPLYPAIALLAARAMGAMMYPAQSEGPSDSTPFAPIPEDVTPSRFTVGKAIGAGILVFDLTLMLASSNVWRNTKARHARLAFIEAISVIVPTHIPLFADPEVGNAHVMVFAYRLGRKIDSKPITCAERNAYFLVPVDGENLAEVQTRILASSKIHEISLVTVLSDKPPARNADCLGNAP
jgi:hypothetical protein